MNSHPASPSLPQCDISGREGGNTAVVLGMFETGLAVGRSLGRAGIRVIGLDACRKVGFHSKYIQALVCPHPLEEEEDFIAYLLRLAKNQKTQPVLFVTADEFLLPVSRNRQDLEQYYLINLPFPHLLEAIVDKFKLYELAQGAGIPVPRTFIAHTMEELLKFKDQLVYPAFIKGAEVTQWRKVMGVASKGIVVESSEDLVESVRAILDRGTSGLVQEIIPGPDTNHYKASCYVSRSGEILLAFGLQKIRQQPPGFGFGCLIQSIEYPALLALGKRFLQKISYRGVGSAEFKLDPRDGKLKLIELNPRYWQQNALAERCGMNFPLIHYLDMTGGEPKPALDYRPGVKWLNIYSDFDSFREYRRRGQLSVAQWLSSLRGEKVYSDLAWDDPLPGLHTLLLENILRRSARFMGKPFRARPSGGAAVCPPDKPNR
jgi:D-aspartate ligase